MKTWLYFYIKYTVKNGKPFYKESGWAVTVRRENWNKLR